MRIFTCFVMLSVMVAPVPASAQQPGNQGTTSLIISERAIADGLASAPPAAAAAQRNNDSKKNGAIIGAIVGGVALGGFVGFLCNALKEPGDPSCLPWTLLYVGVGAGIGAVAGLGIDALIARQPQQFPPAKR